MIGLKSSKKRFTKVIKECIINHQRRRFMQKQSIIEQLKDAREEAIKSVQTYDVDLLEEIYAVIDKGTEKVFNICIDELFYEARRTDSISIAKKFYCKKEASKLLDLEEKFITFNKLDHELSLASMYYPKLDINVVFSYSKLYSMAIENGISISHELNVNNNEYQDGELYFILGADLSKNNDNKKR